MPSGLQYDEQGRPFFLIPGTNRRTYVSPVAMGTGERPADETGLFRSAPQWNARTGQWETPVDWGNVMNVAVGGALGGGVAHAAGAFGGGAGAGVGAGGGALPSTMYGLPASLAAENAAAGAGAATAGKAGFSLIDGILMGGTALGNLWGANTAANASKEAAEIQAAATREALALQKEMYEQDRADFAPYLQAGSGAIGRASSLLDQSAPPSMPASVTRRLEGPGDTYTPVEAPNPQEYARSFGAAPADQGGLVPLTAPDGSRRMVPRGMVPVYRARWAQAQQGGGS